MANEKELLAAQQWCDEARKILKITRYAKTSQKVLDDRIRKIFSELAALDKGVRAGKFGLTEDDVAAFVQRFLAMSGALNEAARTRDLAEVDRQSLRMSELKKELAVALATSKRGRKKATEKLDERSRDNVAINAYVDARDTALDRMAALRVHAQAEAIEAELDALEKTIESARARADLGDYPGAMQLLGRAPDDCDRAEAIADDCAIYEMQLFQLLSQLASLRQHEQAEAGAPEFDEADRKIEAAAALAGIKTRDYAGARARLDEAQALSETGERQADACQAAIDAREPAAEAIVTLSQHAQVASIATESGLLARDLVVADGLAGLDVRKFDEAVATYLRIVDGAAAAGKQADQCQAYVDELARVQAFVDKCGEHAQAAAVEPELDQAGKSIASARQQAEPGARDYAGALRTLQQAYDLGEQAARLADLCQQAIDAGNRVRPLVQTLALQRNNFDSVARQLEVLERKLVEADLKAAHEQRDYAGAVALYEQVEKASLAAQAQADKGLWDQSQEKTTKLLLEALESNPPERSQLEALWALASEQADDGKHGQAVKTLAKVRRLATQALESKPDQAGHGKTVKERSAEVQNEIRLSGLLEQVQTFIDEDLHAVVELANAFGSVRPEGWKRETDRITGTLALERNAGPDGVHAALEKAKLDLQAHETAVRQMMKERDDWLARLKVFDATHATLKVHAGMTGALVGRLQACKDASTLCKRKATGFEFTEAENDLQPQIAALDELLEVADAGTACAALRAIRSAELAAAPACAEKQATDARQAALKCLADADAHVTNKRFPAAIEKLEEMPKLCETIRLARKATSHYNTAVKRWVKPKFNVWETLEAKYKTPVATELDLMRNLIAEAKRQKDTEKNIIKAGTLMSGLSKLGAAAEAMLSAVKDYVDQRAQFEIEYGKVETHAGRAGIEPFYERVKADRQFVIDGVEPKREFKVGTNLLKSWMPQFAPQLAVAVRYESYKTRKDDTLREIEEVRKLAGIDQAAAETANCQKYLDLADQLAAAATAQASAAQLDAATAALDQALAAANAAKAVVESNKQLQDMQPAAGGSDLETLKARVSAFPAMKQHVREQAGDGTFDTVLADIERLVQQADAALKRETPDTAGAAGPLDQADEKIRQTLAKAQRKGPYSTLLAAVEPKITTSLPALNVSPDDCLGEEIRKLGELLAEAKNLAKAPDFDFAQALGKLTQAEVLAGRAKDKHAEFKALAADRQVIKTLITKLDDPGTYPGLGKELARLRGIQSKIDDKLAAFDFAAARKITADGKALKAPYDKLCQDYTGINAKRTKTYGDAVAALAGKPEIKREHDEYLAVKARIDTLIDTDHAFAAAGKLLVRVAQIILGGTAEAKHYKVYADARKDVTDRLPTSKAGSNDGVKDLIEQVESELRRAEEFAGRRELVQATLTVEPLVKVLDRIDTDKPLFAAYATSRDTVLERLKTVSEKKQLDFVVPLVGLADGKRLQALKAAERRDFVAARKLADEAAQGLQDAIDTADRYTEFEALGEGGEEGKLQALNEAADRVDAKLDEIANPDRVPPQEQLPQAVADARTALKAARDALAKSDTATAAARLKDAGAACARAEAHKLQWEHIRQQQIAAKTLVETFVNGPHTAKAFVATRMAATLEKIASATQAMISRGSEAAARVLIDATDAYHADVHLADRRKEYLAARLVLEPDGAPSELSKFESHARRHAAAKDIESLRARLAEAAAAADAKEPDFDAAMRSLKAADTAAAGARLALNMLDTAVPPSPQDIAKVLDQPGGPEKIDEMVKNLDPSARRRVLQVAFKVRFGCKLAIYRDDVKDNDPAEFGLDVARLYENFAKLPPKHTLKNDMLLQLSEYRDATTPTAGGKSGKKTSSSYNPSARQVSMRDGSAATSAGRDLGARHALGNVVDPYRPANDDPVLFVDWNTLHEAGHAVETQSSFMKTHARDALYGGWVDYGMDTDKIAEKLATEFAYDRRYIAELLAGDGDPAIPDPDDGVSYEVWEQRRQRVRLWAENASAKKKPWETDAAAQALKLASGEIIHQAYETGRWFGYLASARAQGITGYQFRAPVEWFSELYAAYYLKKLQPGHPANTWLGELAAPDAR